MSDNFYTVKSNFSEPFWTSLPTLKSEVIDGRSLKLKTEEDKINKQGGKPKGRVEQKSEKSKRLIPNFLRNCNESQMVKLFNLQISYACSFMCSLYVVTSEVMMTLLAHHAQHFLRF